MTPSVTMREYAIAKTLALMDDLRAALKLAAEAPDEEAVHKLRVAIRRFQQALRLFGQYLKPGGVEKIKAKLRVIMQIAGELRNRDIAIGLTTEAGGNAIALADQRAEYDQHLATAVRPLVDPTLARKWRRQLGLDIA
jgi:CHAD domain-containing protein